MKPAVQSFLAVMLTATSTVPAQIIERIAPFQPVSISYVKAASSYRGKQIEWRVVCTTIDETSGAFGVVGDTVLAMGDSVQVRLIKYDTKYTYYKVLAASGSTRDSLQVQVFSKGSMQKYLFQIPVYSSKPVPVYLYLPSSFSSSSSLLVVMHGIDRNALNYGLAWTSFASANNTVLLTPEFNSTDWSTSSYTQGNIFTGSDGTGSLNIKDKWTFTIVRDIERKIGQGLGLNDSSYTIWGHSAGAQFVHRMVLFAPDMMMKTAIAANAGWYTAPDTATVFPWGVKHPFLSVKREDLVSYTERNLIVMRGTADTLRDADLNVDPLSDLQGRNRYQRAGYFFQQGKNVNSALRWLLVDVPGVGHDYRKMATAAGDYLTKGATAVKPESDGPSGKMLLQNYPNPFNPTTTVQFSVPAASRTSVVIYSMLGERIRTLTDEFLNPGVYTVRFDGSQLASGMYLCRLSAGSYSTSVKLVLLK